jgi:hypothetical protein
MYVRHFSMYSVCSSSRNYQSVSCTSNADVVCRDIDVFEYKLFFNHVL